MVYIIFHNQTDAMRCRSALNAERFIGTVVKAPRVMSSGSCAWAVKIKESDREYARQFCISHGINPCAWYTEQRGKRA